MVGALFDTNILIDYLNGIPQARQEIQQFESRAISIMTWIEVLVGEEAGQDEPVRRFLDSIEVIALDDEIANRAVELRREHRIKLPDAVIWATAQAAGYILVSRNTKDFPSGDPAIRHPYVL